MLNTIEIPALFPVSATHPRKGKGHGRLRKSVLWGYFPIQKVLHY